MVTRQDWLIAATATLAAACEDAAFDARCLLEDLGGLPRGGHPDGTPLTTAQQTVLDAALSRRAQGYPLQYILGNWDFLDLTLRVGEGVLIPRADTECLCEEAARRLAGVTAPRVLDLCAGSGCVGLGVARLTADAVVTAVELSDQALPYLRENVARYPHWNVTVQQANVLTDWEDFSDDFDAIVSNPPYIPTAQLPTLMREVQYEPAMALDGDVDGLVFYRTLATHWSKHLKNGGFLAVEVGFDQSDAVTALFRDAGLQNVTVVRDLNDVERVVVGVK